MKLLYKTLFALFLFACFFSSCKEKGCTDKNAVNFNVTANEDDGSCIVCDITETKIDSLRLYLKDKKIGSPYYNQNVATFFLGQYMETPNDKACGKEKCLIKLNIKSLVNQDMYFGYYISTFSGPVPVGYNNDVTINANESVLVGQIETLNSPPYLNLSLDSLTVTSNNIIYF